MYRLAHARPNKAALLLAVALLFLAPVLFNAATLATSKAPDASPPAPQGSTIDGTQHAGGQEPPPAGEGDPDDLELIPTIVVDLLLRTNLFMLVL